MLEFADVDAIRRSAVLALGSGEDLTPVEAAESTLIDHKTKLHWSSSKTPYMVEPLNKLASRQHRELVVMGPSRSGKSFALGEGGLAYILTQAPGETMFVQMNMAEAETWSKVELEGTLSQSPKLAAMRLDGVGDDTVKLKRFDRMNLMVAWPSRGRLSGKTARYVIIIDGDNGTGDLSVEEVFALAQVRIRTYLSAGMCVTEGNCAKDYDDASWSGRTPHEAPPAQGMASLYNGGSRHCRYWQCPHCVEYFQVKAGLELFRLPDLETMLELVKDADLMTMAEQFARIICPHCTGEIRQDARERMDANGHWLSEGQTITADGVIHGEVSRNPRASYWIAGVQAAFNQWHEMLLKIFRELRNFSTTGDCKAYGHVLNTEFCYPHISLSRLLQKSKHAFEESRLENWPEQTVPAGVRYLMAAVDVQGNRFVVQVKGYGVGLQSWVVDWYAIRHTEPGGHVALSPHSKIEDWARLKTQVINRRYALNDSSGRTMPVVLTVIDSGGRATDKTNSVTAKAYEFWRALSPEEKARCRLSKGVPNAKEKISESMVAGNIPLLIINTNAFKDQVDANLKRVDDGPGKMHFSRSLNSDYFAELTTSERQTPSGWIKNGNARNEALDTTVMCDAGCVFKKMDDPRSWANPPGWALDWDRNTGVNVMQAAQQNQMRTPQRGTRSSASVW